MSLLFCVNISHTFSKWFYFLTVDLCLLFPLLHYTFKRQPHKMVKLTQTIRRQQPTNCLSLFDHFVGLALKGLYSSSNVLVRSQQCNTLKQYPELYAIGFGTDYYILELLNEFLVVVGRYLCKVNNKDTRASPEKVLLMPYC